ncbi:hypothetical protein PB2503_02357 [Parvularcula bermudensis HTCC2503]|uniref:Uncharacterized protein n=1 Tax=Parvularcula bermudensis (strain ATCC BAA-594 / HTCC2503 / KCTC 12087) TaxID=314260 RepID=E0TCB6_PARBH|nr:hypothetical protein [Parvularcula bermudensis]ADM08549.1 hypothetical protein PB2503_02357 [Parvularcula bermudensis HTCC2503]
MTFCDRRPWLVATAFPTEGGAERVAGAEGAFASAGSSTKAAGEERPSLSDHLNGRGYHLRTAIDITVHI